eukprot:13387296-Ditylum_brightwellii.AAC.1
MPRPGKASDITKSHNALVQNDNENKLQIPSGTQLKDHALPDVKGQRPGKASDITKSQNVLVQNKSENKSQMPTNAQLKDHVPSGRISKSIMRLKTGIFNHWRQRKYK